MDGFSYTNIFATKGIEYLAIIAFLILLIPFWILLNKRAKITRQIKKAWGILSSNILRVPQGIFYSKNHTWTYMEKSGLAQVGLDDLLIHLTGDVRYNVLRNQGDVINKGDLLAEIEQNNKQLRIFSPISGKILKTNSSINEDREETTEDPYEKMWIYKIKPTNWVAETSNYYLAEGAVEWTNRELGRFKDFLAGSMTKHTGEQSLLVLQDGGEIRDNTLSELPNDVWQDFQKEFLNQPS